MPAPRITTLAPLPEAAGTSTVDAADSITGRRPRDCIIVKAAPYPPAWPTLNRKSRLLKPIWEPLAHSSKRRRRRVLMVEWRLSGLLSLWEQELRHGSAKAWCARLEHRGGER